MANGVRDISVIKRGQGQSIKVVTRTNVFRLAQKHVKGAGAHAGKANAVKESGQDLGATVLAGFFSTRYKLVKRIPGGKAVVFKAHDRELGMDVALKFLPRSLLRQSERIEEVKREAGIAMRLTHEGIVRLYTMEMKNAYPFLVMEYVEGETLREILDKFGALSPASVLGIIRECMVALEYAHAHGVLHRDLKPENVMITSSGHLKILDFGAATTVGSRLSDYIEGTPGYMAPEQVTGGSCDTRADVFALGSVLWELLAGVAAFPRRGDLAHMYDEPPAGGEGLEVAVRAVLEKAMSVVVRHRWSSVREFGEALIMAIEAEEENLS